MDFERSSSSRYTLNLTPLIDMVFLLVVFFMLTTTFVVNQGISLSFATSDDVTESVTEQKSLLVFVFNDGAVKVDNTDFSQSQWPKFRSYIYKNYLKGNKGKILVHIDETAKVQDAVSIMDQIQLAGGTNIILVD